MRTLQTLTPEAEKHLADTLAEKLNHRAYTDDRDYAVHPAMHLRVSSGSTCTELEDSPDVVFYPEVKQDEGRTERPLLDVRRVILAAGTSFVAVAFLTLVATQNGALTTKQFSEPASDTSAARIAAATEAPTPDDVVEGRPLQAPAETSAASGRQAGPREGQISNPPAATATATERGAATVAGDSNAGRSVVSAPPRFAAAARPAAERRAPITAASSAVSRPNRAEAQRIAQAPPAVVAGAAGEETIAASASNNEDAPILGRPIWRSSAMVRPGPRPTRYASVRAISGGSDHEVDRITRALDAGASNGRDRADLYLQRALLYLNQGDNSRANDDFMRSVEVYEARIRAGDRVADARVGLAEAKKGLRLASDTIVY